MLTLKFRMIMVRDGLLLDLGLGIPGCIFYFAPYTLRRDEAKRYPKSPVIAFGAADWICVQGAYFHGSPGFPRPCMGRPGCVGDSAG